MVYFPFRRLRRHHDVAVSIGAGLVRTSSLELGPGAVGRCEFPGAPDRQGFSVKSDAAIFAISDQAIEDLREIIEYFGHPDQPLRSHHAVDELRADSA
jgi:hypothetical protein